MPENIIYILLGLLSAALISLMLFFARKMARGEEFEIKARKLSLFDDAQIRVAISFANKTRQSIRIKDLQLVYLDESLIHPFTRLSQDPYVEAGASEDNFKKEADGSFSVPVSSETRLDAIYVFELLEHEIPQGAKTMLSYADERGRRHYAPFSLKDRYGQLLLFKRRNYKWLSK